MVFLYTSASENDGRPTRGGGFHVLRFTGSVCSGVGQSSPPPKPASPGWVLEGRGRSGAHWAGEERDQDQSSLSLSNRGGPAAPQWSPRKHRWVCPPGALQPVTLGGSQGTEVGSTAGWGRPQTVLGGDLAMLEVGGEGVRLGF